MTERSKYIGKYTPEDLANTAYSLRVRNAEKGKNLSPNLAIVAIIKEEGIATIKDIIQTHGGTDLEKAEVEAIFEEMNPFERMNLLEAFGGILFGSVAESLHYGAFYGWSDRAFPETFNRAIMGTIVPSLDPKDFELGSSEETRKKTTEDIQEVLKSDKTFVSFFQKNNSDVIDNSKLPSSIVNFFAKKDPMWKFALGQAFSAYKKVLSVGKE